MSDTCPHCGSANLQARGAFRWCGNCGQVVETERSADPLAAGWDNPLDAQYDVLESTDHDRPTGGPTKAGDSEGSVAASPGRGVR